MQTWHQQPSRALQSFLLPLAATSIHNAPFCRFFLTNNHPTTQFLAITSQPRLKLIKTGEANFSSLIRRLRWYHSISYCRRSPPNYRSTPMAQRSINASNMQPLINGKGYFRAGVSLKRLRHCCPRKSKCKGQEDGNLRAIQPFTRWCCIVHDVKWLIYHTPTKRGSVTFIKTRSDLQNKTDVSTRTYSRLWLRTTP